MKKFYITAAIPYVNAKPHLGHALEFVQGDVIARLHRLQGDDTLYLTGADENALKIVQAAEKAHMDVQAFCDQNAVFFQDLAKQFNTKFDIFNRATNPLHHKSSKLLWKLCNDAGDIYKKTYEGLYCVGCEAFYTRDELDENGECFEHPGKKLDTVTEENYFFKLSKYKEAILTLVEDGSLEIVPDSRKKEVLGFLHGEVQDISISRTRERARSWGVEVPDDPSQMMYVWFDALNVYQSGIGFGTDDKKYATYWPADVHVIGKGIIRFHAVYWIAMLLSAKLQIPKKIFVHGYITVDGQKMSKSLGNVIDPVELVKQFGTETSRYYLLREISTTGDADFSFDRLRIAYAAHLQNGLGNLVSRTAKLCENLPLQLMKVPETFTPNIAHLIDSFQLKDAMDSIWDRIAVLNKTLSDSKVWEKDEKEKVEVLLPIVNEVRQIAYDLQPFLPDTASHIMKHFSQERITAIQPIFPKLTI